MMKRPLSWCSFICALLLTVLSLLPSYLFAQTPSVDSDTSLVTQILISGNQRVEIATIKDRLQLQAPAYYSRSDLNEALKRLFATNFFNDVRFELDQSVLTIFVEENPTINFVVIEGNLRVRSNIILPLLLSRPRTIYKVQNIQTDVNKILDIYSASGRYAAQVQPKVIPLDNNRVNVVFEVNEGPRTQVRRIVFIGNTAFTDSTLHDTISSQESRWYRFVGGRSSFDEGRVALDRRLLIKHYQDHGYPLVKVRDPQVELDPTNESFYITFKIEENKKYRFGKTSIITDIPGFSTQELEPYVYISEGQTYDVSMIEESKRDIENYLGGLSYAFANASHQLEFDHEKQTVDVVLSVKNKGTAYIEKIDIHGNSRTWDDVIRREFRLEEGDSFNTSKIQNSVRNIRNLNVFKNVDVKTLPGSYDDSVILDAKVVEAPTNRLRFAVGYSSREGPLLTGGISEDNLLGRNNRVAVNGHISGVRIAGSISYTHRYIFDQPISATYRLFSIDNRTTRDRSYDYYSYGGSVALAYDLSNDLRQIVTASLNQRNVSDIDDDASIYVKSQEGKTLVTSVRQTLIYDRTDVYARPTEGYFVKLSSEFGLPPGGVYYAQFTGTSSFYYSFSDTNVLNAKITAGHITGMGKQKVRLIDRFYKGGMSFKGFDFSGVGPRDTSTDDSLGGQSYVIGTLASRFDLGLPKEYQVQGIVYTDIGTLTNVDDKDKNVVDTGSIRMGYGFGVEWLTPVGPLVMLFSNTILREDHDEERLLLFTIGTFN